MKNTARNVALFCELLIFGIISLVLFVTIPEERLEVDLFWLAFAFAIPVNFCAIAISTIWGLRDDSAFTRLPIALSISISFGVVYLIVGAFFMYLDTVKMTFPIVLYSIITVIFLIAVLSVGTGVNYINNTEMNVKLKRIYISMLEADVLDCAAKSTNPDMQDLLSAFADDVRYSDPMSHSSLSPIETDISTAVHEINAALTIDANADITASVSRARALLKSRNNRCMMLKQ